MKELLSTYLNYKPFGNTNRIFDLDHEQTNHGFF
jgi:hypothetical protein